MKKTLLWTAVGFGLAVACGLLELAHLSATLFTVTVFCASWMASVWAFGFIRSLPDCILTWAGTSDPISAGGTSGDPT